MHRENQKVEKVDEAIQIITNISDQKTKSEWTEQYQVFMEDQRIQGLDDLTERQIQQLSDYSISFDLKAQFTQNLTLRIVNQSINGQVIVFSANWGWFSMKIKILNVVGQSPFHCLYCRDGSHGSIFMINLQGEEYSIKCTWFENTRQRAKKKILSIREYFIFKIAAALKVGPSLPGYFGFDMIMYNNCLEFAMEKCEQLGEQTQISSLLQLKVCLQTLHRWKIIHNDIKPPNIMYSHRLNKIVFIDFGLSQIVDLQIGSKRLCNFRGTYNYCYRDMVASFESGSPQLVDLYYNDCYGLQQAMKIIKHMLDNEDQYKIKPEMELKPTNLSILKASILITIKFLLYNNQINAINRLIEAKLLFYNNQHLLDTLHVDILTFLEELPPTDQLRHFYHKNLATYHKEGIQFINIHHAYTSNSVLLKDIKPNKKKKRLFQAFYQDIFQRSSTNISQLFEQNNKENIEKYLKQIEGQDTELYFQMYLKYISFTINSFDVSMQERHKISIYFFNKFMKNENINGNDIDFLFEILVFMLKWYISQGNKQKMLASNTIKRNLFLFDLIEHMFLLNRIEADELLKHISSLMKSVILTTFDKIEFILRVRRYSKWWKQRILFKCNQNPSLCLDTVLMWCIQQAKDLQLPEELQNWLNSYLKYFIKEDQNYKYTYLRSISTELVPSFACQLKQIVNRDIFEQSLYDIENRKIQQIFRFGKNASESSFSFDLLLYLSIFNRRMLSLQAEDCGNIFSKIDNTLKCPQILKEFVMNYKMNYINGVQRYFLIDLLFLLTNLTSQTFTLHSKLIDEFITIFYTIKYENIRSKINKSQYQLLCKSIKQELQRIVIIIQQYWSFQTSYQHFGVFKRCINHKIICHMANIQTKYCFANYSKMFNQLQRLEKCSKIIKDTPCLRCRYVLQNYYLLGLQKQVISSQQSLKPAQKAMKFYQSYHQIVNINTNSTFFDRNHYLQINDYYLYEYCLHALEYEKKFHGIEKIYLYYRNNSMMERYFYNGRYATTNLQATMEVVFSYISFQQFVQLLINLADTARKWQSKYFIEAISFVFGNFMFGYHQKVDIPLLYSMLKIEQQAGNTQIIVYYFHLIRLLPTNHIVKYKIQMALAKAIKQLSFLSQKFLEMQIYCLNLHKLSFNIKSNCRKEKFTVKKLLRIFHLLNNGKSKKFKDSNSMSKALVKLNEKLSAIDQSGLKMSDLQLMKMKVNTSK